MRLFDCGLRGDVGGHSCGQCCGAAGGSRDWIGGVDGSAECSQCAAAGAGTRADCTTAAGATTWASSRNSGAECWFADVTVELRSRSVSEAYPEGSTCVSESVCGSPFGSVISGQAVSQVDAQLCSRLHVSLWGGQVTVRRARRGDQRLEGAGADSRRAICDALRAHGTVPGGQGISLDRYAGWDWAGRVLFPSDKWRADAFGEHLLEAGGEGDAT